MTCTQVLFDMSLSASSTENSRPSSEERKQKVPLSDEGGRKSFRGYGSIPNDILIDSSYPKLIETELVNLSSQNSSISTPISTAFNKASRSKLLYSDT